MFPFIITLEPNGITLGSTAMVLPATGIVPDFVGPPAHLPQHAEQLQYAVELKVPKYVPTEEELAVLTGLV